MSVLAAKDILRVDLSKLIRFWVRSRPDPTKNPKWVELGHFFAGFDYKLARIREIDGSLRENALCYSATGTFQLAQNALSDWALDLEYLTGPIAVAMLFGRTWEPTHGKLLVHDWAQNADSSWNDGRIAIVADPAYNSQLYAGGTISGFVQFFNMYDVKNLLLPRNGALQYGTIDSLFDQNAISTATPNSGF